jgi:hypothetical protein
MSHQSQYYFKKSSSSPRAASVFVLCVGIHISDERFFLVAMRAHEGESQRDAHQPSSKLQKNLARRWHNNMSTLKPGATMQTSAP